MLASSLSSHEVHCAFQFILQLKKHLWKTICVIPQTLLVPIELPVSTKSPAHISSEDGQYEDLVPLDTVPFSCLLYRSLTFSWWGP